MSAPEGALFFWFFPDELKLGGVMNRQTGFTLIELMIVVTLIGILAAIGIPQFSEYTRKTEDKAAQVDAKNFLISAIANSRND